MAKTKLTRKEFEELYNKVHKKHREMLDQNGISKLSVSETYPNTDNSFDAINERYSIAWDMWHNTPSVKLYLEKRNINTINPYNTLYRKYSEEFKKGNQSITIDSDLLYAYRLYIGLDIESQKPITKCYKAYFFSHIRYDIWDKGEITLTFTSDTEGTATGMGFYRNKEYSEGVFHIVGERFFMDLKIVSGDNNENWFKFVGKVDSRRMKETQYFRVAYVSISSYPKHYTSAIEVVLLEKTFAENNENEVNKVKRYLMLQRHRFQSDVLAQSQLLEVLPSSLHPNHLVNIIGNYACFNRVDNLISISSLAIDEIYRTILRTSFFKYDYEKNHQLCYFELSKGYKNYVLLKGYQATEQTDEPNLQSFLSTFIIPLGSQKGQPIKCGFNGIIEIDDIETIWAGSIWLVKLKDNEVVKPSLITSFSDIESIELLSIETKTLIEKVILIINE
ncbi:MAG: hypothetical protein JNL70_02535 [Saprospiraceae bacterium]|nr:hypothetical protein [Saprospiraceae bacterium]